MIELRRYYERLCAELDDAYETFLLPGTLPRHNATIGSHRAAREGVVVHVYDAWGRFIRAVVMASLCRRTIGLSGLHHGPPPFPRYRLARAELESNRRALSTTLTVSQVGTYRRQR